MSDIQHTLATNLRKYRKQAGLSQEELAEKCGVHRTYVGGIEQERVNVSINNVERLARALKISPALLFVEYNDGIETADGKRKKQHADTNETSLSGTKRTGKITPARTKNAASTSTKESPISYYLASIEDERFTLTELQDPDPNLTVSILCELIAQDPCEETLSSRFNETQKMVLNFLRSR